MNDTYDMPALASLPRAISKPNDPVGNTLANLINAYFDLRDLTLHHDEYLNSPSFFVEISSARLHTRLPLVLQDLYEHLNNGPEVISVLLKGAMSREDYDDFMSVDFSLDPDPLEWWFTPVQEHIQRQNASRIWTEAPLQFAVQSDCIIGLTPVDTSVGVCRCTQCNGIFSYPNIKRWLETHTTCPHCQAAWTDFVYYTESIPPIKQFRRWISTLFKSSNPSSP